jgi:hypothetical protein
MLLAQAWVLASLVPVLMRLPLGRLRAILEPARPPVTCDDRHTRRVLAIVNLALQSGRPSCLTRGVTRYYFLAREKKDIGLAFGIGRPTGEQVAGHCWLVQDGEPFLETHDPRPLFTEVYRIGAAPVAC